MRDSKGLRHADNSRNRYWVALRWFMLGLLFIAMVNSYIDRGNISYAIKLVAQEFDFGDQEKGWVFSFFLLGYSLCLVPAGMLVDRFGIKWSYAISFFFWGLVAAGFGFTQNLWQLLALRLMLGVFEAISGPASVAFIAKYFTPQDRGFASGIWLAGTKIGPAFGAVLAVYVIELPLWQELGLTGWRMLFILCGLIPLTWLIPWLIGYWLIDCYEAQHPGDVPGRLESTDESEKRSSMPLTRLLRSSKTWGIFLGYFCYGYTWYLYINWFPSYLQDARGMSLKDAGWWAGFAYGGLAIVTVLAGLASDYYLRQGFAKFLRGAVSLGGGGSLLLLGAGYLCHDATLANNLPPIRQILFSAAIGVAGFTSICLIIAGSVALLSRAGGSPDLIRKGFVIAGFLLGSLVVPVPFIDDLATAKTMLLVAIAGAGFATANAWAITQMIAPSGSVGALAGIQGCGATAGGFLGSVLPGYLITLASYLELQRLYSLVLIAAGLMMLTGIVSYVFLVGKLDPIPYEEDRPNAAL